MSRKRRAKPAVYEDVWREVFLAGTEWDQLEMVGEVEWDFSHLDEALNEGGVLHDAMFPTSDETERKMVHLFGCTEPQLLITSECPTGRVLPIPVIVAVVSTRPPPAKLGIKSVQRTEEELVSMADLKMGWFPVLPAGVDALRASKGRALPPVAALKCERRRVGLRNMSEESVKKYDYVLPYVLFPDAAMEEDAPETVVNVMAELGEAGSKPLVCEFDWEMDELDEFVREKREEEELDDAGAAALRQAIQDAVKAEKAKIRSERDARRKAVDDMDDAEKASLRGMQLYKFYPCNTEPDLKELKTKYINRYYNRAHHVM